MNESTRKRLLDLMVEAKPNLDDLGRPLPGRTNGTTTSTNPKPTIKHVGTVNPEGATEPSRSGAFGKDEPKTLKQRNQAAQKYLDKTGARSISDKEIESLTPKEAKQQQDNRSKIKLGLKAVLGHAFLSWKRGRGSGRDPGSPNPPGDVFNKF